eukprot:gb/GECH01012066.1/.p1 GENE.gb/GECH01012066.1/~~gb/GECH01012066.1/.p1  ORF type:complete len:357 (+),score=86.64 gb/GECH01012066.1/:1-1071(+)
MVAPLADSISAHAWNADKTRLAISPNSKLIHIYKVTGTDPSKWEIEHTLKRHDQVVTAISWAPKTNRILSCAQDRNAYVWNFKDGEWKPTLVLLRLNRAATCCAWSCNEEKFAVGSSAKVVSVCYFEEENDWWVSKVIKKHKSTVLNVAWHPTSPTILATASSDFKCRVFSAFIKEIDSKENKKAMFGKELNEYAAGGWVLDVSWSPSGDHIAFIGHDSSLSVADTTNDNVQVIKTKFLPFRTLTFLSDNAIIAAGHDFSPVAFSKSGDSWAMNGRIDEGEGKKKQAKSGFGSAFAKFEQQTSEEEELKTRHKNSVSRLSIVEQASGKVSKFSTSGIDGRVVIWNTSDIKASGFSA